MTKHIGVDVDGVVADFNTGFIKKAIAVTGRDLFPPRPFDITTWNYPEYYGYTPEETRAIWTAITESTGFWAALPAYRDTLEFLTTLSALGHRVTFITARPGIRLVEQTRGWLSAHGYEHADVIISSNKGDTCRRIGVTHYIDDKNENIADVVKTAPDVYTVMLAQPWNREQLGAPRIETLGAFLDILGR